MFNCHGRAQKAKAVSDINNPYGDRPGSAKALQDAYVQLMKAIDDMDDLGNKPEGLDYNVWDRFCMSRRAKIESEQQVSKLISTVLFNF